MRGVRGCLCPGSCRGGQRDRPAGVVVTATTRVSVGCLRIPVLLRKRPHLRAPRSRGGTRFGLDAGVACPGSRLVRGCCSAPRVANHQQRCTTRGSVGVLRTWARRWVDVPGAGAGDGCRRGAGVPGTRRYRGVKGTPGRDSHAVYLSRVCSSLPPSGLAKTAVDPTVSDRQIRRRTNLRTRRPGLYPTTAPLTPAGIQRARLPGLPASGSERCLTNGDPGTRLPSSRNARDPTRLVGPSPFPLLESHRFKSEEWLIGDRSPPTG